MTRKATEVLLSLEGMVKQLLNHARNNDMLIKTLINKLNVLEGKGAQTVQKDSEPPVQKKSAQIPGLKPGVTFRKVKEDQDHYQFEDYNQNPPRKVLVKYGSSEEVEDAEDFVPLEKAEELIGKRRTARYVEPEDPGKLISVQQKILYPDGRSISGARVEVFIVNNNKLELVKSMRTTANGKWTGQLPSGNYVIKIHKKESAQRPAVDFTGPLNVPVSNGPAQLKPIQV